MTSQLHSIHHVTSMASDPNANNRFFTRTLGLRRVKKTVNFDVPDVYHLYFGDQAGTPGSLITYFPFPDMARGTAGTGEVETVAFAIPAGSGDFWRERLAAAGVSDLGRQQTFGETRLVFAGPDGERLALIEVAHDKRRPGAGEVDASRAIHGFHSVSLRVADAGPTAELLRFMGLEQTDGDGAASRFAIVGGNGADIVDLHADPAAPAAEQGAGSVHHVAFAVADEAAQSEIRQRLLDAGHPVTKVLDRSYFKSIYFRTPGGILFEIATDGPGFAHDEDASRMGGELKLPPQHEHLREKLEATLTPIVD